MAIVLAIPDPHSPFTHPLAWKFVGQLKKQYKPDFIVFLGDVGDFYGVSRFVKDPDGPNPGKEVTLCEDGLQEAYRLFPNAKVCVGNHDTRIAKRAAEASIPACALHPISHIIGCPPGWEWADNHIIDGVLYTHGDGFSGKNAALSAAEVNRMSTVIGHIHAFAGIQYTSNGRNQIFGMNCGCLIDLQAIAFAYGKHSKHKPVLGCGLVINGVPHFMPLV